MKYFLQSFCNITECITFVIMKRTIITVEVDPELREHLKNQADKKKVSLSRYVRAALKKASGYKEKAII